MLLIGHHFWQTCNYHGALRSTKIYFTICNFNSVQCMFSSKSAPLFIFAPKENPYIFFIRRRVSIITMLFLCFHQCWWYELIDFFFYNYSRDKSEYVKWFFLNESETEYCIDNLFCDITTGHKLQINQIPYLSNYLIKSAPDCHSFINFENCIFHYFPNLLSPRCEYNISFRPNSFLFKCIVFMENIYYEFIHN